MTQEFAEEVRTRFIRIGQDIINLNAIAYITMFKQRGDAIVMLNVPRPDGQSTSVRVPKEKVPELLAYLESLMVLDLQWESKE